MQVKHTAGTILPEVLYIDDCVHEYLIALPDYSTFAGFVKDMELDVQQKKTAVAVYTQEIQVEHDLWRYKFRGVRLQ